VLTRRDAAYFRRLLAAGAVDVLQADATRCLGVSGFPRRKRDRRRLFRTPVGKYAPAVHVHPCCAVQNVRHLEWFHDHVRIERLLFDGSVEPERGYLQPDLDRPGLGLELKRADAARYVA
jgi:L-alanine-DL-glutamate epimerase-like enolase superfamily enzyme